jgi:hypothetical protein
MISLLAAEDLDLAEEVVVKEAAMVEGVVTNVQQAIG